MSLLSLGKQSMIYGFGHILARLGTFLLLPLLTHSLSTSDYGVISTIYIFIGFTMTFYRYGMDTALMKFYIDQQYRQMYLSSIFILQLITSIVLSAAFVFFKGPLAILLTKNNDSIFIIYITVIIFCDIIWNLLIITFRVEGKAVQFIGFNITNVLLLLGFTIYFVNIKNMGVEGVLLGNVCASVITCIFSCVLILWSSRFSIRSIDLSSLNKIISFGLPFLPAAIFGIFMEGADRFILKYILDESAVGIYSAGYKLGVLGLLVVMGFNMGWTPYFLNHNDNNNSSLEFSTISTIFLGLYGFIGIIITSLIPVVPNINIFGYSIIGPEFFGGLYIVPLILMSYYFFAIYVLLLPRIYRYNATNRIPYFKLMGAISNIALNFALIPILGIVGSAFATLISFLIMTLCTFYYGNRLEPVDYNLKAWVFPLLIWDIIIVFNNNYEVIVPVILLYPIIWYKMIINNDEQSRILKILK